MGFMDETSSAGGPPILKWTKEAKYLKRGSDEPFNDQEFVADVHAARGGYIKFGEKGQAAGEAPWLYLPQGRGAAALFTLAIPTRASGSRVGSATSRKTRGRR